MDILVLTWNYPPRRGGMENLMGSLCGELRKRHGLHIITAHAPDSMVGEEGIYRAPWPGLFGFAVYALWRGAVILARERTIRILFGGSTLVTPLVLLLARVFRRRAAVLTHGLDVIHRNLFYQLLCVRWLKFCDRVVANSHYTAALVRSKGVAPARLAVIPPGLDTERFSISTDIVATKRRWSIEGKKIVLFVGRLAKRKGVNEFIEASLVDIVREVPETVFLIVGDNPTDSLVHRDDAVGQINETVSRLGLHKQVRQLGALSDDQIIGLYHACDVVVLPALDVKDDVEGFGIVALEAAAAGKPVIATRVGGIPEAVENSKNGFLVEPGDYRAMTHAVLSLLRDSSQAWAMGEVGRQRAMSLFAWQQIRQKFTNTFSSAISAAD